MRSEKGFSFAELLVAVTLMGIASIIALPNLQEALRSTRLGGAGRRVVSELRLARMLAMATQDQYELLLAPDRTITIRNLSDGTIEPGHGAVALPWIPAHDVSTTDDRILFDRDGTSPGGAITLTGAGSTGTIQIVVYRSGLARVMP
jgi:prepilin-type N-terminal cleavage/methylation domain-containing protein